MKSFLGVGLAMALACGGGEEANDEESTGGEETHEHHDHHDGHDVHATHDHGEMPPALSAFHDAFAEHWHGDRSAAAVCPGIEDLKRLSDEAAAEHTEHPDEVQELIDAGEAAMSACPAGEGWDAAFSRWHDAMHGIMHTSPQHE